MHCLIIIGFLEFTWVDLLDIVVVSVLLYQLYAFIRGSLAVRIFIGFLVLYLLFVLVRVLGLELLSTVLEQFTGVGVLAIIVLFQPEIRRFLSVLGTTTTLRRNTVMRSVLQIFNKNEVAVLDIEEVLSSLAQMASTKTGVLLVISKDSSLEEYTALGDKLDALISRRLLLSIFQKNGPMHDGAAIIYQNRIVAARCILPVSEKAGISAQLGTRHRAALGISEQTSAAVMVVSEETGGVSWVEDGRIATNVHEDDIRHRLLAYIENPKL